MKKLLALLTAALMVVMLAVPAFAAPFDYTDINGTSTKLKKYLVIDKDTNIPGVTFTFTVAPGSAVAVTNGNLPVYAGTGTIPDATVSFTAGETATAAIATEADSSYTNKIAAKHDITFDFTSAQYNKPGVYRYIVTEQASSVSGVKIDTEPVRTIDVYVEDNNGVLEVKGYVAYEGTYTGAVKQEYTPDTGTTDQGYANGDPNGNGATDKSNKYVNEVDTNELTLEKVVAGNQGDKESQWEMKVNFETLPTGYNVKYAKIQENGTPIANPTYANYTNNSAITLGHGDKYDFKGIPEGVKYTVTETRANQDGYTTTYTNEEYTFQSDSDVEVKAAEVTNTRNGVIPTGVAMGVIGGVVLVGLVAAYFIVRRKLASR